MLRQLAIGGAICLDGGMAFIAVMFWAMQDVDNVMGAFMLVSALGGLVMMIGVACRVIAGRMRLFRRS